MRHRFLNIATFVLAAREGTVRRVPVLILAATLLLTACGERGSEDATPEKATLTAVGEMAPRIRLTTLDRATFDLAELRGRVVVINFFATWCGPCRVEIPHLEQQVWARFRDQEFAMIGIGREHSDAELESFVREFEITYPVAADSDRSAYGLYASQYIPRNVVIGRGGTIVYQSTGYSPDEFKRMLKAIELALTG